MPKTNKDLLGYFGRSGHTTSTTNATAPPAAAAAPAAPPRCAAAAAGPRTAASIAAARAAAAPDAVPSAAAAGRQSDDSTKDEEMKMEVEEPAAVMPEVNRKLSAGLKNEVDKRWDETEADGEARWSPGCKHERDEEGKPAAASKPVASREQRRGAAGVPGKDKKKGKKGKKKSPEQHQGQSWTFPQAAALKQPPLAAVSPIAVQYNPPGPAGDELELAVVLKSFPGDKHLPELDGDGLVVHVTIEADQFCMRGSQIPVLSNLPRRFTFGGYEESTGAGRRIVVYVSTAADNTCETSFDGTATPIQWDADEYMSEEVWHIIDAAAKTDNVRTDLLDSYGCVVDVPPVMRPTTDELLIAQGMNDHGTLREWHERITDQHHLLSIAERLIDRCVCNFRMKSKEHFLKHQERAKKKKAAEARAAGKSAEREDGVLLNFDALNDRFTNSVMVAKANEYREEVALPMFKILKENGEAITHGCENNQDINYGHPAHKIGLKQPLIYYAHEPAYKSGSTGNGSQKEDILTQRFDSDTQYYKAVGLSNISPVLQREKLSPLLLKGLRKFRCPRAPETVLEAILYDMIGPTLGFQLHAMAVTEPYDENVLCSGALNVTGFLYNHYRMAIESGYQLDLTEHGLHHVGAMFEHLMSGGGGLYEAVNRGLEDFAQRVHNDLVADDSNDYSNTSQLARRPFSLAWKVGRLETCPRKFQEAKKVVAWGISDRREYSNGFGEQVPVVGPKTIDECYDYRKFTPAQCKDAVTNTEVNVIVPVEKNGGFQVLDVNQVAFDHIRSKKRKRTDDIDCEDKMPAMCQWLLERDTSASLDMPEGGSPKWEIYMDSYKKCWKRWGFILMKLKHPKKKVCLLALVSPWCRLMFNKKGTPMGFEQMEFALRAASSSSFVEMLEGVLCTDRTTVDRSLTKPISKSPLFICSYITIHCTQFQHCIPRHINLIVKGLLSKENFFGPEHHGMARKEGGEGHELVVGSSSRRRNELDDQERDDSVEDSDDDDFDDDEEDDETKAKKKVECYLKRRMASLLQVDQGETLEIAVDRAYEYLKSQGGSGNKYNRFKIVMASGILIADSPTYRALEQKHDSELPNSGNTSGNHHSASAETKKNADDGLRKFAKSREPFILQVAGVAAPGECIKADGSPWDPSSIPQGARATLTFRDKDGVLITGITYWDSEIYVPGNTWGTVRDKCKTGSNHWLKEYKLVTQTHYKSKGKGSVKLNDKGDRVEVANDLYFVICTMEKRRKKDDASTVSERKKNFFKKKKQGKK